jgi:hypothetical protein
MSSDDKSRQLSTATGEVPTKIPLGQTTEVDLSILPEDQRQALLVEHARNILDIDRKARELGVEATVLRTTLDTLAGTTKDVADAGNSITLKHLHKTATGQTEAVLGNTSEAEAGKLGAGFIDAKTLWIGGALVAAVLIAAIAFGGG